MKRPPRDQEREQRITMEIIVDAYTRSPPIGSRPRRSPTLPDTPGPRRAGALGLAEDRSSGQPLRVVLVGLPCQGRGRHLLLPRRAGIHGTRPARRRTTVPGLDGAGGTVGDRHRLQRAVLRLDQTFTDPRLCAAIVDRLTFAGQIIETGTTSYRLAQARKRRAAG
jgi:hypothetical protein